MGVKACPPTVSINDEVFDLSVGRDVFKASVMRRLGKTKWIDLIDQKIHPTNGLEVDLKRSRGCATDRSSQLLVFAYPVEYLTADGKTTKTAYIDDESRQYLLGKGLASGSIRLVERSAFSAGPGRQMHDLRGKSYTEEDLGKSLFGDGKKK